ncbi:MAG TPA: hypothetical protein VLH13_02775, partial [Methanomassiliicoccales archaeon]|nr:hypothetical protein [Methanomassiliicoccales archaeon]
HGFIYYALTWKARDIISPGENTKIVFLISSVFLLLLVVSVIMLAVNPQASGPGEVESSTSGDYGVPGTSDQADRTLEYTSVGSLALVMVTATYFVTRKLWRPKQPRPHESEGLMFDDPGED